MNRGNRLSGRHVAVLAADGVEKVELSVPVKALRSAGAKVDVVSLRRGKIRGMNLHEPAGRIRVDKTVREADPSDYDALLIPGGFINPDLLRQSAEARNFARAFDNAQKPIASLCHGPWVLASAGIARGRTMTSWPGIRDDLVHAGATWLNREVVRDGNLLTSRGPQDLGPFVRAMTDWLAEAPPLRTAAVRAGSAPQQSEPPRLVLTGMKWLPRPSARIFFALGAIAAFLAVQHQMNRH